MTSNQKIAWLTVGALSFGIWAAFFGFVMIIAAIDVASSGLFDATGFGIVMGMVLIFVVLPALASWRFFKSLQRLSRQRRDKFVNKRAFE